jgi:hypothetical protein
MRQIHHITRQELLFNELPNAQRFTDGQSARAFRRKGRRGWGTAMTPEGPPFEMVAWVHEHHPLAHLVRWVREGGRWLTEGDLNARLGGAWMTACALQALSKVGLAVAGHRDGQVQLRPADPRAVRFVNESRRHVSRRGYKVQCLIEAFLPVRNPGRTRLNVKSDRRLAVALNLESDWDIEALDLLDDDRDWIRLVSRWTVPPPVDGLAKAV